MMDEVYDIPFLNKLKLFKGSSFIRRSNEQKITTSI